MKRSSSAITVADHLPCEQSLGNQLDVGNYITYMALGELGEFTVDDLDAIWMAIWIAIWIDRCMQNIHKSLVNPILNFDRLRFRCDLDSQLVRQKVC